MSSNRNDELIELWLKMHDRYMVPRKHEHSRPINWSQEIAKLGKQTFIILESSNLMFIVEKKHIKSPETEKCKIVLYLSKTDNSRVNNCGQKVARLCNHLFIL